MSNQLKMATLQAVLALHAEGWSGRRIAEELGLDRVAVCTYNLLAAVKGALRGVHGDEVMEAKVSNYFLTNEISTVYGGMMIALPPHEWEVFQTMPLVGLAKHLNQWARAADLENYPKHPRGPKKTLPDRPHAQFKHVSTAKLLAEAKAKRKKKLKPKVASP